MQFHPTNMPLEMQNVHTDISYQQLYLNQSSLPSAPPYDSRAPSYNPDRATTIPPPPPGYPSGYDARGSPSAPPYNPGQFSGPPYAVPQTVYPDPFPNGFPTQPYQVSVYRVPGFWDNGGFYQTHAKTIWIGGLTVIAFIFWMSLFWQNS
jgi:hypothetical protein